MFSDIWHEPMQAITRQWLNKVPDVTMMKTLPNKVESPMELHGIQLPVECKTLTI